MGRFQGSGLLLAYPTYTNTQMGICVFSPDIIGFTMGHMPLVNIIQFQRDPPRPNELCLNGGEGV